MIHACDVCERAWADRGANDANCPWCRLAAAEARAAELTGEVERLRGVVRTIPSIDDIELGLRANNMGGLEYKPDYCQCDPSVGQSPCPYCAIDSVLNRMLKTARLIGGNSGEVKP